MNIGVTARHMDVTDAMRQYVEAKLGKLPRYYDSIQSIEATLDMEADQASVEIVVTARRKHTFVASHHDKDMYACVDKCIDKITQQIRRHKDRVRGRQAAPTGQAPAEPSDE